MKVVSDVRTMFGQLLIERNPQEAKRLQKSGEWEAAMESAESSALKLREMLTTGDDPADAARVDELLREHLAELASPVRQASELQA